VYPYALVKKCGGSYIRDERKSSIERIIVLEEQRGVYIL
jgi:hypothetical protein